MKILLHCSESPGSIGYDICFFINNPTARSITQRVLILLLITISVFLFCFNVYLVLPYLYPDKFTDNLPDSAKSFFRDNVQCWSDMIQLQFCIRNREKFCIRYQGLYQAENRAFQAQYQKISGGFARTPSIF